MVQTSKSLSQDIPESFPARIVISAISGAHPKLTLVELNGLYHLQGAAPEDRRAQYEMCEDLAHQGAMYCKRKLADGAVADLSAGLKRLETGLKGKDWCSTEQKAWIIHRVAGLLELSSHERFKISETLIDTAEKLLD